MRANISFSIDSWQLYRPIGTLLVIAYFDLDESRD